EDRQVGSFCCHGRVWPACGNASEQNTRLFVAFPRVRLIQGHPFPCAGSKCLGPMIFWSIVIAITATSCAALFYAAAGRPVNASATQSADHNRQSRLLLTGIEADRAAGKIGEAEAEAAKAELAREILRANKDKGPNPGRDLGRLPLFAGLGAV